MTKLRRTILKSRLVEVSFVAVPMNPDALILQRSQTGAAMPDANPNPNPAAEKGAASAHAAAPPGGAAGPVGELTAAPDPLKSASVTGVKPKPAPTRANTLLTMIAYAMDERGLDFGLCKEIDSETRRRSPWKSFGKGIAVPLGLILEKVAAPISALAGGQAASAVGTEYLDGLFFRVGDALRGPLVAAALGIPTIVGSEETLRVPFLSAPIVPSWPGRDGDLDLADATFDAIEVKPLTVGALVTLKRSAILYGLHPSVESIIPTELSDATAYAIDRAILYGGGTDEPVGVYTSAQAGGGLTDLASAFKIADKLISYQKSAEGAKWLLANLSIGKLNTTAAWAGAVIPAMQGNSLAGYPSVLNLAAPDGTTGKTTYMFANWGYVSLCVWDSLSVVADPYTGFKSGAVSLRILGDCNTLVRDDARFFAGDADKLA